MYNKRMVDILNLRPEDIQPINFIHALSCINRYTGHTPFPISVALHSDVMTNYVPLELARAAYIHDWTEALFNDLASPLKAVLPGYKRHEKRAQAVIAERMGVSMDTLAELKEHGYDRAIRQDERIATWGLDDWQAAHDWKFDKGAMPLGVDSLITDKPWHVVRQQYTDTFHKHFRDEDYISW